MATGLLTKPDSDGNNRNDQSESWYNNKLKDIEENYHKDGKEPGAQSASSSESATPKELSKAESSPEKNNRAAKTGAITAKAPGSDKDSQHTGGMPDKGLYTPGDKGKRKGGFKKGGVVAVIVSVFVGGSVMLSVLQLPKVIIRELRELIGNAMNMQTNNSWRYRRRYVSHIKDLFSKDGRMGSRVISEMTARGYKFQFDPKSGKIIGLTLGGTTIPPDRIADRIDSFLNGEHPIKSNWWKGWKTKRMNAFYNRFGIQRSPINIRGSANEPKDPEKALSKKLAEKIMDKGADSTKISGGLATAGDGADDQQKADVDRRNAENAALAEGEPGDSNPYRQLENRALTEGLKESELTATERAMLDVDKHIDQSVVNVAQEIAEGSLGAKVFSTIKGFVSSTDILDKVCTVKNRLNAIQMAARYGRALALMHYTSAIIIMAEKAMTSDLTRGDIDPDTTNAMMQKFMAPDKNGNYFSDSPGYSFLVNGNFSRSQNDALNGNIMVDGTLGGILGGIQGATNALGPVVSSAACNVVQNVAFQIGDTVVQLGAAAFTGGTSTEATGIVKAGFTAALKKSLETILTKQMAKYIAKEAAKGTAVSFSINMTFEGALALVQLYAEKTYALPLTTLEKGGELGEVTAGGAGRLYEMRALHGGMVPATPIQYATAKNQLKDDENAYLKTQSLYARTLDYNNTDSLAFALTSKAAMTYMTSGGITKALNSGISRVAYALSNPTYLFSAIGHAFLGKTFAADPDIVEFNTYNANGTELATDPLGNLLPIMRDDIANIDPVENASYLVSRGDIDADTLEPKSDDFKEHIKNCVEQLDILTVIEKEDQHNVRFDCLATRDLTKRFKAHLAYLDMLDSIEADLFPEEISVLSEPPNPLPAWISGRITAFNSQAIAGVAG